MMIRYFVLPVERSVAGHQRGPKYFAWRYDPDPPGIVCPWSLKDYGMIDEGVLCADIEAGDLASVSAHADVFTFPNDLDANMPQGEMTALAALLESAFAPAHWLTGSLTYRAVLRTVTASFLFMQALTTLGGDPRTWGITLNTRWNQLTTQQQGWITGCVAGIGYDVAWIAANTTMRNLIKGMADQWGSRPILFGFATL